MSDCAVTFAQHNLIVWLLQRYHGMVWLKTRGSPGAYAKNKYGDTGEVWLRYNEALGIVRDMDQNRMKPSSL